RASSLWRRRARPLGTSRAPHETRDRAMAWPPLPASDAGLDYRAAALRVVRKHCGWHIAPVIEDTITLDGSGGRALLLPTNRVVEVLAVREDGTDLDLEDIEVSATGVLRKRCGRWSCRLGGVEVVL